MDEGLVKLHLANALAANKSGDEDFVVEESKEIKDLDTLKQTTPGGVYLGIYEVLFRDQESSGINFQLPQTVVYRFNRPMAWYCTVRRPDGRFEVLKKRQSSLKNALVLASFLAAAKDELMLGLRGAAQQQPSSTEKAVSPSASPQKQLPPTGADETSNGNTPPERPFIAFFVSSDGVRYLDRDELQPFLLLSKEKIDGILQLLEAPKSKLSMKASSEMVRCAWTPIISYVERRRNLYSFQGGSMRDKTVEQHRRIETFEGEDYTTSLEAPVTSKRNLESIKRQCSLLAEHYHRVSGRRLAIQNMVVNMKIMDNAELMFLWADGVSLSATDPATGVVLPNSPMAHALLQQSHATPGRGNATTASEPSLENTRTSIATFGALAGTSTSAGSGVAAAANASSSSQGGGGGIADGQYAAMPRLSLETRHKMHSVVEQRARQPCRQCDRSVEKKEFVTVSYHTLLSALNEIWWSSEKRQERIRRLQRMKRSNAAREGGVEDRHRPGLSPSTSLATSQQPQLTSPRSATGGEQHSSLRMATSEAWRHQPFTTESFTSQPLYQVTTRDTIVSPAAKFVTIPAFVRRLHPFMKEEHFLALRERKDFLETKCTMCTRCFFDMTADFASTSSAIGKVYKDEVFEQSVQREERRRAKLGRSRSQSPRQHDPTTSPRQDVTSRSSSRSGRSTSPTQSARASAHPTAAVTLHTSGGSANAHAPKAGRGSNPLGGDLEDACGESMDRSGSSVTLQHLPKRSASATGSSSLIITMRDDRHHTQPLSRSSIASRCMSELIVDTVPQGAEDAKKSSAGAASLRKHSSVSSRRELEQRRAQQRQRLDILASSFVADWSPTSLLDGATQHPADPQRVLWSRMRSIAKKAVTPSPLPRPARQQLGPRNGSLKSPLASKLEPIDWK